MSKPSLAQLTDPAFVEGLSSLGLDEVRRRREQCQEAEDSLSLERRLVQGRLDIVQSQLDVRAGGSPVANLVESLPEILGDRTNRASGPGRLLSMTSPDEAGPEFDELLRRLDEIVDGARLSQLGDEDDDALRSMVAELGEIERSVSSQRHALHTHLDALQAEIIRRYKSGEASVEGLLES